MLLRLMIENPALPEGPETMGSVVYALLWVMQDLYIINRRLSRRLLGWGLGVSTLFCVSGSAYRLESRVSFFGPLFRDAKFVWVVF